MRKIKSFIILHLEKMHFFGIFSAIVLVSMIELKLVDRKFGILSGGFGASQIIDTKAQFILVIAQWIPIQIAGILVLHALLRWLLGKRWNGFLALGICWLGMVFIPSAVLFSKYKLLEYFGDAMEIELVRRLGGGSILEAFLYVSTDIIGITLGLLVATAVLVWFVRILLRFDVAPASSRYRPGKYRWLAIVSFIVASIVVMAFSNHVDNIKFIVQKFVAPAALRNTVSWLTDWDRDGYGYLALQTDPMPFDASIYPLAYDVPGNGIDEDGYCGDFSVPSAMSTQSGAADQFANPATPLVFKHLILVVLESTRSDVLAAEVHGKPVTPILRQLARQGSASKAYSHAGFTAPSLVSLFTGRLEPDGSPHSLFDDFKAKNFNIGVISGQAESFGDIDKATGMRKNADLFIDAESLRDKRAFSSSAKGSLLIDENILFGEFESNYGSRDKWEHSNMIYINFQSAHFPYNHPGIGKLVDANPLSRGDISPQKKEKLVRTYRNAVAWSDHWIGEIDRKLTQLGVRDDVLLVVTADHGESLFDDGFLGHGHQISNIQTQVPLILSQSNVKLDGALGLNNLRELILQVMMGMPTTSHQEPVFQYIGGLESPSAIGTVGSDGERVVLKTISRKIDFGDGRGEIRFDLLHGTEKAKACKLVQAWETYRFINRSAAQRPSLASNR